MSERNSPPSGDLGRVTYYTGQYQDIARIFVEAVHQTAAKHYADDQVNAWSGRIPNDEHWRIRCEFKRPFVYEVHGRVAGFLELDTDGHIDCHYVDPAYNRRGIGGALLAHAIQVCDARGLDRMYVEASHVAKGLYLKHGFRIVRPNTVTIDDVTLDNWIMERLRGGDERSNHERDHAH